MAAVEWIEDQRVSWLGEAPPTAQIQQELVVQERQLTTSEKILIVSLFLNVVTLAWQMYQWRAKEEKK